MLFLANIASLVLIGLFFFEVGLKGKIILLAILLLSFLLPAWNPIIGDNGFPTATIGFIVRIFLAICYLTKRKVAV